MKEIRNSILIKVSNQIGNCLNKRYLLAVFLYKIQIFTYSKTKRIRNLILINLKHKTLIILGYFEINSARFLRNVATI